MCPSFACIKLLLLFTQKAVIALGNVTSVVSYCQLDLHCVTFAPLSGAHKHSGALPRLQ